MLGGMIHWAPGGAREAACGTENALMLSNTMSRPSCPLCRELITVQIESLKYIVPDDEPSSEASGEVFIPVAEQAALVARTSQARA